MSLVQAVVTGGALLGGRGCNWHSIGRRRDIPDVIPHPEVFTEKRAASQCYFLDNTVLKRKSEAKVFCIFLLTVKLRDGRGQNSYSHLKKAKEYCTNQFLS